MNNYRIKIENEFDFNFLKKYFIDNKIGGSFTCVSTSLTHGEDFESLEYRNDFIEFSIETYTQEQIDKYLSFGKDKSIIDLGDISPNLWDDNRIMVGITTHYDLYETPYGDVNHDVEPISVQEFLLIDKK